MSVRGSHLTRVPIPYMGIVCNVVCDIKDQHTDERFHRNLSDDEKLKLKLFHQVFKLDKLASNKCDFGGSIKTDGICASVSFKCDMEAPSTASQEDKFANLEGKTIMGLDPGRVTIAYVVKKQEDGEYKKFTLSRKQYYRESGITLANKKISKWLGRISIQEELFARHSPKTANTEEFRNFLLVYTNPSVYNALWKEKTKKRWGQQRFRLFNGEMSVLDRFFQSLHKKGERKPMIAYGGGKFPPNGKGEMPAPTTKLHKTCAKYYR